MNINELIAQIDALYEEMLDTRFINEITVHWPAISAELKRLEAANEKARTVIAALVSLLEHAGCADTDIAKANIRAGYDFLSGMDARKG